MEVFTLGGMLTYLYVFFSHGISSTLACVSLNHVMGRLGSVLNTRAVQVDVADVTIVMIEIIAIGVAVGAIGWITSKDANLILSLFVLLSRIL